MNEDDLLRPPEVAEMLGVSAAAVGTLPACSSLPRVRRVGSVGSGVPTSSRSTGYPTPPEEQDVVRLCAQGWPIRRVAAAFGLGYGRTRRILLKHAALRTRRTYGL
ncbi:hypothetical protein GCM10023191_007000 [Actinoallomurus oryzae]|uniref:Helix-turn-helix domain-containing protein n=1 Tax=Actinoallomurus oryzae TaxID=502180 RepID=A0ABP8PCL4_9ACTN